MTTPDNIPFLDVPVDELQLDLIFEDMLDGLVGGNVLHVTEASAGAVRIPELRRRQSRMFAMRPASLGPPLPLGVAAVVDELLPLAVGDRDTADAKAGHVDDVCGSLVVE